MTDTMLEKAARALAERWRDRDQHTAEQGGCDIRLVIDGYLPSARDAVRLVLSAIREPDETTVEAGAVAEGDGNLAAQAVSIWHAMIDAILAGES